MLAKTRLWQESLDVRDASALLLGAGCYSLLGTQGRLALYTSISSILLLYLSELSICVHDLYFYLLYHPWSLALPPSEFRSS